jgi:hypothetical protein
MDLAPVLLASDSVDQALRLQPINKLYSAVMLDLKTFREICDSRRLPWIRAFHRQHELVMLRFEPDISGSRFAEVKKPPNLVPKFRQRLIGRMA